MLSTLTSRGQTTIPKEVRKALGLKSSDKILYILDKDQAILKPLKGNILDLRGTFHNNDNTITDVEEIRDKVKEIVSQKIIEDLKDG